MAQHNTNWTRSGYVEGSSPADAEVAELPSSFIMDDGTDWNLHIGSIFGNPMPREPSSIDFGMTGYPQDDYTQSVVPSSEASGLESHTFAPSLTSSPHQDEITLQDVIDADDTELMLLDHEDPWSLVRPVSDFTSYPQPPAQEADDQMPRDVSEGFEVVESADPCYARLLWKCLREAPGYTLSLKDIYDWIRQHTQKARDPKNKGWQNSVRHNLSMNAAFERVASSNNTGGESKKGSLWRLTEHAVETGVISTTRYRRDPKRKPERRGLPAPKRQMSGAKGGAATRAASQYKRQQDSRARQEQSMSTHMRRGYTTTPESLSTLLPVHMMRAYAPPPRPYYTTSPTIMQVALSPSSNEAPPMHFTGDCQQKGFLRDFELSHLDCSNGLFNNVDTNSPYSPSLLTESSFYTDDAAYVHGEDTTMNNL